jgi:hypothetical protein
VNVNCSITALITPQLSPAVRNVMLLCVQVRYILGYSMPRHETLHEIIQALIQRRAGFQWRECVMVSLTSCQQLLLLASHHMQHSHACWASC